VRSNALLVVVLAACAPVEENPPYLGDYDAKAPISPGGGGGNNGDASVIGDAGTSVIAPATNAEAIYLSAGSVYYTSYATGANDGTVSQVSTLGGTVTNLATLQNGPWGITVASSPYFTLAPVAGTGGVEAVAGGTVTPIQQNINGAVGIVTDGTNLYWTLDSSGVIVEMVALSGGTPKQILDIGGDIHPQGLTLSGADLYIPTTGTQAAVLHGLTTGTGNLSPLDVQSPQTFADVAVASTTVYATIDDIAPNGQIIAYPRGTGSPTTLATGLNHPQRLALDGTNLYFTDPAGGNIWVINLTTTTGPVIFASGLDGPLPIAVADAVYVGTQSVIVRLVKL
jgi:hypothetical protein